MRPTDFITQVRRATDLVGPSELHTSVIVGVLDEDLVEAVRRGPIDGQSDLEVAIALCQLAHDELAAYGTDGSQSIDDRQCGRVLLALTTVLRRVAVPQEFPFRNFTTFRSYWLRHQASGSWQARRDLLERIFGPLHLRLAQLEERTFQALATPISPWAEVGWPVVDEEIRELRRRFGMASTTQDYRAIGTNCVGVLEALSDTVYDASRHLRTGESIPPRDRTNIRIGRYIEDALHGQDHEELRGLAVKTAALAHHVKHSPTANRTEAGIAGDAVILLANMLRRLEDQT